jgi:C_GCAxxG_C_C family probable redox protein
VEHSDKAEALFMRGYNCAQATAAAFAEDFGLEPSFILTSTARFSAGVGGLRETCGAVGAMAYLAGLHIASRAPGDASAKTKFHELTKKMVDEFTVRHGTICCKELLEKAACTFHPDPSGRNAENYPSRPCARIVASAAEIIARTVLPSR